MLGIRDRESIGNGHNDLSGSTTYIYIIYEKKGEVDAYE